MEMKVGFEQAAKAVLEWVQQRLRLSLDEAD
jgi:hypothetical protein